MRSKYSRKPVANSQKRKLWVSLMVLMHQYVLLLALVQAQKGPTAEEGSARRVKGPPPLQPRAGMGRAVCVPPPPRRVSPDAAPGAPSRPCRRLTRPERRRLPVPVVVGEAREARHAARVVVLQAPEQLAELLLALLLPQQPHLVLLPQALPRGTQGHTPHTSLGPPGRSPPKLGAARPEPGAPPCRAPSRPSLLPPQPAPWDSPLRPCSARW